MRITLDYIQSVERINAKGSEIRINCPNCEDSSFHCYCNLTKMLWHCFKCDSAGKIHTSNNEVNLEDYSTITEFEKRHIEQQPELNINFTKKTLPVSIPIIDDNTENYSTYIIPAYKYLLSRGLSERTIKYNNLRVCISKFGLYRNSIIFPIYNSNGSLKYFVARRYDGSEPKYINAFWEKGDTLYLCKPKEIISDALVITEGIFDAIAVSQAGYMSAALLGKVANEQQIKRINEQDFYTIFILLDTDALKQAVDLVFKLKAKQIALIEYPIDASDAHNSGHNLRDIIKNHDL